jgi:DNA repair exonuclease SbcCD ATPase subunit
LERLYVAAVAYETQYEQWSQQKVEFDRVTKEADELKATAEEWKKGKEALVKLRVLVKQHLIPSLNKVASHLIKGMTGGQRQVVTVDDEFEVTVDGQPLNTLSGSGKAVANLALRIALGQVLTNNVMSVFMGDEIDASMDKNRAENTTITFQYLRTKISQILLVTHKFPSADYYILMADSRERLNKQEFRSNLRSLAPQA